MAQRLKCLLAMRETRVQSLGQEDPLEKEMSTHSSTLASNSKATKIVNQNDMNKNIT